MTVRDAELETVNENEYWMDAVEEEFASDYYSGYLDFEDDDYEADDDDWTIEDDTFYDYDDEFADDFIDWEIDFMDDEI